MKVFSLSSLFMFGLLLSILPFMQSTYSVMIQGIFFINVLQQIISCGIKSIQKATEIPLPKWFSAILYFITTLFLFELAWKRLEEIAGIKSSLSQASPLEHPKAQ